MKARTISVSFVALVNAVVLAIAGAGLVSWTLAQQGLVNAEATAGAALVLSLYFHFKPKTKEERVAVGTSVVALAATSCGLLSGFHVWALTDAQNGLIVAVVTSGVAFVGAIVVRSNVEAAWVLPAPTEDPGQGGGEYPSNVPPPGLP